MNGGRSDDDDDGGDVIVQRGRDGGGVLQQQWPRTHAWRNGASNLSSAFVQKQRCCPRRFCRFLRVAWRGGGAGEMAPTIMNNEENGMVVMM